MRFKYQEDSLNDLESVYRCIQIIMKLLFTVVKK